MRRAMFALALCGGLMVNIDPDPGEARIVIGGPSLLAVEGAKVRRVRYERFAIAPHDVSFRQVPLSDPYDEIPVVVAPYVPSGVRATPDYEYLYTPALTDRSAPSVASYRYAADRRYLISPASSRDYAASHYGWEYSASYRGVITAAGGYSLAANSPTAPVIIRKPGQKIDSQLKPILIMPGDQKLTQPSMALRNLRLREAVRPLSRKGSEADGTR